MHERYTIETYSSIARFFPATARLSIKAARTLADVERKVSDGDGVSGLGRLELIIH